MNDHSVILKGRELLYATGVKSTELFRDERVLLHTVCGDLAVKGGGLTVGQLDMTSGELEVRGRIDSIEYLSEGRHLPDNLIGRLFK